RNVGLLNTQYGACLSLRETAVFDDAVDLQRKMSLELLAFRISETDVGEYIAAAFFESHSVFFLNRHDQLLLCRSSRCASISLRRMRVSPQDQFHPFARYKGPGRYRSGPASETP